MAVLIGKKKKSYPWYVGSRYETGTVSYCRYIDLVCIVKLLFFGTKIKIDIPHTEFHFEYIIPKYQRTVSTLSL